MKNPAVKSIHNNQKGYTLLFAVLTAALVLGVAVFILSISRGQFLLASAARESTYAIYAADSGIECAAKAVSETVVSTSSGQAIPMTCLGKSVPIQALSGDSGNSAINGLYNVGQSSLYVDLGDNRCAQLTVFKGMSQAGGHGDSVVQIESRGYNYCSYTGLIPNGPATANPKVVERAMRLTYTGM